jgi:hypothetical protein
MAITTMGSEEKENRRVGKKKEKKTIRTRGKYWQD